MAKARILQTHPGLVIINTSTSPSFAFTPAATEPVMASPVILLHEFRIARTSFVSSRLLIASFLD